MSEVRIEDRDAFEALGEEPADHYHAAVVDYPWEFETGNGTNRFGHSRETGESDLYDVADEEGMAEVLEHLVRLVKGGGWLFIFADDANYPDFRRIVEETPELERRQTVFWDSDTMGMGAYFRVQAYPIITATVGSTERYVRDRPNVIRAHHFGTHADYHTQKPVELYRQLLAEPVLREGESLIEPFMGTAPGKAVALERGLDYTGWDVSEEALALARERSGQSRLA